MIPVPVTTQGTRVSGNHQNNCGFLVFLGIKKRGVIVCFRDLFGELLDSWFLEERILELHDFAEGFLGKLTRNACNCCT